MRQYALSAVAGAHAADLQICVTHSLPPEHGEPIGLSAVHAPPVNVIAVFAQYKPSAQLMSVKQVAPAAPRGMHIPPLGVGPLPLN